MSFDAIELALGHMTDFAEFERLATEVMYLEGWDDIRPLGGKGDLGQDAVSERFYGQSNIQRTVFQYTLQQYLPDKVKATIVKLLRNDIDFTELVIVTPRPISAERIIKMKRTARTDHSIALDVYEGETIRSRLADLNNGLFHRHFPDLRVQLEDITRSGERLAAPETHLERTLLQVSLALTFRAGAPRARKSLFDHFVLAVIVDQDDGIIPLDMLHEKCAAGVDGDNRFSNEQIHAAVRRLAKKGLVSHAKGTVRASEDAISEIAAGAMRLSEATTNFATDILAEVVEARGQAVDDRAAQRILRNVRAGLVEVARARAATWGKMDFRDSSVLDIVRRQLDEDVADLVVAAMADALRAPTQTQAETIARWTQAYVGLALMGFDPVLGSFQESQFSNKIFFLDTDIVLEAIVPDGIRSRGIGDLLVALAERRCRLIVPESVVDECIRHAALSRRTYEYFGDGLMQLGAGVVEERVWNVFVKGYYYSRTKGRSGQLETYERYLANYYEKRSPRSFFVQVIRERLPEQVEIQPADLGLPSGLDPEDVERFTAALQEDLAARSKKAQYRRADEERALAETDARLYLSALKMNSIDESQDRAVLGGTCYLLTETLRYERVADSVGVQTRVSVRPGVLGSILDTIGVSRMSPATFVQLFDNPLLDRAVGAAWSDVEKLMRSGVDLRGMSLARLRFDLEQVFHERLTKLEEAEGAADGPGKGGESADRRFLELLKSAKSRGYALIPEVAGIWERVVGGEQRVEELENTLDEAMGTNRKLEEKISFFGRRRQRYLRRFGRRQKKRKK